MKIEFHLSAFANLVRRVAGIAAHIERGVAAAFVGSVQACLMAAKTQIFFFITGRGFDQLVLVFRRVRVVALEAIAHCRLVYLSCHLRRIFVGVAGETELVGRCGDQLYVRDLFIRSDLMATGATGGDCGMNRFAFGLVLVTLQAG
jgi:hypothetical protein